MGSEKIWTLDYRESFAFIGVTGREEANERLSHEKCGSISVSQVFDINKNTESKGVI